MKRLIALISVVTIVITVLNISVFAEGENNTFTAQNYLSQQSSLIEAYSNGDITFSDFCTSSQALDDKYLEYNSLFPDSEASKRILSAINGFLAVRNKMQTAVNKWGDGARERVAEWWNGATQNVPTEETKTPTTDLNGSGAMVYSYYKDGSAVRRLPCDYIVVKCNVNGEIIAYKFCTNDNRTVYEWNLKEDGTWFSYAGFSSPSNFISITSSDWTYKFYGDVRYENGTSAPTDDEFEYGTIKKFDEMSEKDLEDILDDFTEEAERQNPDLSSIEGLLKAIYARMGTLDSDNDNALLSAINANILALVNADKDKDEAEDKTNEELVNTLLEIRDSLKNGTLGTSPEAHGHEISGTVYNVIPLDKNWLNKIFHDKENLKVSYEGTTYYLENCGCLKIGDKYYTPNMNYDSYAIADYDFSNDDIELDSSYLGFSADNPLNLYNKLSFTQRKKVDNIVNSIYQMVTYSIPYTAVTSAFAPFEVIIFNTAVPEDIVLNFNSTDEVGGFSATILSVSFFQNSYVSKAMGIVKPFLMVVIGYCWLKVMRRKVVSM